MNLLMNQEDRYMVEGQRDEMTRALNNEESLIVNFRFMEKPKTKSTRKIAVKVLGP